MLGCTDVPILSPLDVMAAEGTAVEVLCWGVSAVFCDCCVCKRCSASGSLEGMLFLLSVGVMGEASRSTVGDVGDATSTPCEDSLVRFFLRKPSDGIGITRAFDFAEKIRFPGGRQVGQGWQ